MADLFGVKDLDTITRWRRDPRVRSIAMKLTQDRILQVTRKVDSKIAQILEDGNDLTVRELLDIRKEFLGGVFRDEAEGADERTLTDAQELLEEDPAFMDNLRELLEGKKKTTTPRE